MDILKQIFPVSFKAKDINSLIVAIVIYVVVALLGALVLGVLGLIPIIKFLFIPVGWVLELYVVAGIVLTLLDYFKVLK